MSKHIFWSLPFSYKINVAFICFFVSLSNLSNIGESFGWYELAQAGKSSHCIRPDCLYYSKPFTVGAYILKG